MNKTLIKVKKNGSMSMGHLCEDGGPWHLKDRKPLHYTVAY